MADGWRQCHPVFLCDRDLRYHSIPQFFCPLRNRSYRRSNSSANSSDTSSKEFRSKFNVILGDEDGVWIVECPSIPGCVSQGETREKALENIKDAIALWQVRSERGLPLTVEIKLLADSH